MRAPTILLVWVTVLMAVTGQLVQAGALLVAGLATLMILVREK